MPPSRFTRNPSDVASVHPPLRIAADVLRELQESDVGAVMASGMRHSAPAATAKKH
jgi:hypothetical protein